MHSYSRRRNVITPLQILLFYTKSKYMHIFIFTLLYLQRIKPLQYINPPIIVRLQKCNGALRCAAIYPFYAIYNPTNNGVLIKYLPRHSDSKQNIYQISTANKTFPIPLLSSSSSRISQLCLPIHIKTKSTRVLFPHKSMCSRF